jgi:autophagy-related protein 18
MFAEFDADAAHLVTGCDGGLQLYELPPLSTFRRVRNAVLADTYVKCACALGLTPIVAVAGAAAASAHIGADHVVQLYDVDRAAALSTLYFDAPVLALRLNMKRLAVVLESATHLFDFQTLLPLPLVKTAHPLNARGLGALSTVRVADGATFYAFTQSADNNDASRGDIFVLDADECRKMTVVPAHRSPIVALEFSSTGNVLVSCSVKGNMLRVFDADTWQLKATFRRGTTVAVLHSLAVSAEGGVVALTASSGTLHLFRAGDVKPSVEQRSVGKVTVGKERTLVAISADERVLSVMHPPPPWRAAGAPSLPNSKSDAVTSGASLRSGDASQTAQFPAVPSLQSFGGDAQSAAGAAASGGRKGVVVQYGIDVDDTRLRVIGEYPF